MAGSWNGNVYTGDATAEFVLGTNANEIIYGNGANDDLRGRAGNDTLYGGDGNDFLSGGDYHTDAAGTVTVDWNVPNAVSSTGQSRALSRAGWSAQRCILRLSAQL